MSFKCSLSLSLPPMSFKSYLNFYLPALAGVAREAAAVRGAALAFDVERRGGSAGEGDRRATAPLSRTAAEHSARRGAEETQ